MSILESLNWRYAVKRMTGEKVPQQKVDIILEAARLAPTGSGIQPFSIVQITDRKLLEKIQPIAYNQPQITEASHLLVFAAWDNVTSEKIDYVYDQIVAERNLPTDALKGYTDNLKATFSPLTQEQRFNWAARQTYIAFGVAIAAAAAEKVDATPMEGFKNAELDQLLGLHKRGLRSTSLLTIGVRDTANDWLANLKKVRRPKEELVIEL
ncbi:MAG TPA: nitroreductase family protein [Puia sp.]|jgi:nitroreductase|nr:nitroreductase family protein [Puia sp.]